MTKLYKKRMPKRPWSQVSQTQSQAKRRRIWRRRSRKGRRPYRRSGRRGRAPTTVPFFFLDRIQNQNPIGAFMTPTSDDYAPHRPAIRSATPPAEPVDPGGSARTPAATAAGASRTAPSIPRRAADTGPGPRDRRRRTVRRPPFSNRSATPDATAAHATEDPASSL